MPLENRNLKTGTVLHARYKGKQRRCEVVQTDDGLRYRLDDEREFASPSSAGKAAMDGISCNGWHFWSIEASVKPKLVPTADKRAKVKNRGATKTPATSRTAPKKNAKREGAKKGKAMRAASRSATVYGCGACSETFPTMKAATRHATDAHLS